MQDLTSKFSQLYEGFLVMPIEYQIVVSAGLLIALAALKNVWGMLYPVRVSAATLLRSAAFVIHPRKKKAKEKIAENTTEKIVAPKVARTGFWPQGDPPPFELDTVDKFYAVVDYYGEVNNSEELKSLGYSQLRLLKKAADSSPITTEDGCLMDKGHKGFNKLIKKMTQRYQVIKNERDRRDLDAKMLEVEAKHYEPEEMKSTSPNPYIYTFNTTTTTGPTEDDVL